MLNYFNRNGNNHVGVISQLQSFPYFNDFSGNELRAFANIVYVRWFRKEETIYQENDHGIGMYFIQKGSVKLFKNSQLNGNEQISTLGEHDFFGEQSLFAEAQRTETAVALEKCCLIGVFRPDLLNFIDRKPRMGNKILMKLAQIIDTRLHRTTDELTEMKEKLANSDIIR